MHDRSRRLNKKEVSRAQVGPRELKDPRSKEYAIQTLYALKRLAESLRCNEALMATELAEIERYRHWEVLGYPSKDALLEAELSTQGLANVTKVKTLLQNAPKLAKQGEIGHGRRLDNIKPTQGGTQSNYLAARIKRDHPDIRARVEAGEFSSMRAAAIAAGIVKIKSPLDQLRHWWKKASAQQRKKFLADVTM